MIYRDTYNKFTRNVSREINRAVELLFLGVVLIIKVTMLVICFTISVRSVQSLYSSWSGLRGTNYRDPRDDIADAVSFLFHLGLTPVAVFLSLYLGKNIFEKYLVVDREMNEWVGVDRPRYQQMIPARNQGRRQQHIIHPVTRVYLYLTSIVQTRLS